MKEVLFPIVFFLGIIISIMLSVAFITNEFVIRNDCNQNTDYAYKFANLPREQMNIYFKECVQRTSFLE